jgi:hypothetical protein
MNGKQLMELWLSSGLSQRELADKLKLNFNSMHGKIHRYQQSEDNLTNDTKDRVEMEDDINTRKYTSKGPRIQTLEQLIEQCEIDLDEWIIDRHVVNKWEVGAKDATEEVVIHPLFQVKAWLTKREPEAITPVLSPVEIDIGAVKTLKPKKIKHGRALVLADMHFGFKRDVKTGQLEPFHDREALAAVFALIKDVNPDIIVIVGDILDLAEWSDKFIRSPDLYNTTQPAIVEAAWFLGQLRKMFPKTDIYLLEGNHEKRVTTTINKHVPVAFGLAGARDGLPVLSVPNLLGLKDLAITYIGDYPNGEVWLGEHLRAVHGDVVRAKSGATASAILDDAQATTIFGHVHRCEMASKTLRGIHGARTVSAFTPGCLCRIDGAVPAVKARMNWQQGIGVVDFDETFVQITPVPIDQGVAMYQGKHYKGKSYVAQLKAETGWAF